MVGWGWGGYGGGNKKEWKGAEGVLPPQNRNWSGNFLFHNVNDTEGDK
jgi:hypothetical protein